MEKLKKGLVRITGQVSSLHGSVHTSGSVKTGALTGNVSGSITSSDQFTFRVGTTPAMFKYEEGVSIQEGDDVVVVGRMKKGQLETYALKNLSTGATYDHYNSFMYYSLWLLLPVSIGLIVMVLGILLTPICLFFLNVYHTMKYSARMVESYGN